MNVLIVDDSALVRNILKEVFQQSSGINVTGEATHGVMAVEKNRELHPDLIIMDINMPRMNGLEATRIIMEEAPVPIIIFSSILDAANSYQAINYGAVEVMKKPNIDKLNDPVFSEEFIKKLQTIAKLKPGRREDALVKPPAVEKKFEDSRYKIVVIGSSTGGPAAIRTIFRLLPVGLPVNFALVQHLESGFDKSFTQWLADSSLMPVELATDNHRIENGKLLVAPTDKHLLIKGYRYYLDDGQRVVNQKPSVDVLFTSAAEIFRESVIGILLTGMGTDGANGCAAIRDAGGITLVQDQASSTIFGMPRAAIEKNAASRILPLNEIPAQIMELLKKK